MLKEFVPSPYLFLNYNWNSLISYSSLSHTTQSLALILATFLHNYIDLQAIVIRFWYHRPLWLAWFLSTSSLRILVPNYGKARSWLLDLFIDSTPSRLSNSNHVSVIPLTSYISKSWSSWTALPSHQDPTSLSLSPSVSFLTYYSRLWSLSASNLNNYLSLMYLSHQLSRLCNSLVSTAALLSLWSQP